MKRREFLTAAAALSAGPWAQATERVRVTSEKWSRLVIVGGAEDRVQDRVILRKFIEYAGGPLARIRLITAASGVPEVVAQS